MAAVLVVSGLAAWTAMAEDLTLFSAAQAGADAWSWGGAKIAQQNGKLVVSVAGKEMSYGDVYISDHLPFLKDGVIELDVSEVPAGAYTLQILAFEGQSLMTTADVIKEAAQTGKKIVHLSAAGLSPMTETFVLKFWVVSSATASTVLNDLRYSVPIAPDAVLLDKKIDSTTGAETDNTTWTPADNSGVINLSSNAYYGSVLFPDEIAKPDSGTVIIHSSEVKNGALSVQAIAFDKKRTYLGSVDLIKGVGAGMRAARLAAHTWPLGTAAFQIKIWLEGGASTSATIKRILVLK